MLKVDERGEAAPSLETDSGTRLASEAVIRFRAEIRDASIEIARDRGDRSWMSSIHGAQAEVLDPSRAADGHVISVGSGPDVFTPLHDFPLAKHFHLYDWLADWGRLEPKGIIGAIESNLRAIGPEATVELVSAGFAAKLSDEVLDDTRWFRKKVDKNPLLVAEPMTWRVSWESPALGAQERFYHLHPLNYNYPAQVETSLSAIPAGEDVAGILLTGAPMPGAEIVTRLMGRLRAGGVFVFEEYRELDVEPSRDYLRSLDAVGAACDVMECPQDRSYDERLRDFSGGRRSCRTMLATKRGPGGDTSS